MSTPRSNTPDSQEPNRDEAPEGSSRPTDQVRKGVRMTVSPEQSEAVG